MTNKQTSSRISSLAAKVLGGYEPTEAEIKSLAASALSQDEVKGDVPFGIPSNAMRGAVNKTSETWLKHDGFSDPAIPGDTLVKVQFRDGETAVGRMHDWDQNWQWQDNEEGFDAPGAIIAYRRAPEPQPEVAAPAKLDSGELWEFFFGKLKGYVPDELTDDLFEELADHLNAHYLATPPVVEEAVKAERDAIIQIVDGISGDRHFGDRNPVFVVSDILRAIRARSATP